MRYIVFSLFFLSIQVNGEDTNKFSSEQCLKSSFDTTIEHKTYLFGLLKAKLNIKKSECILSITFKELLEKKWEVDLCREPIHIKHQNNGSLSVYKKVESCDASSGEFCQSYLELQGILQDHGLIFAKGDREKINDPHGKVYCTYLLLNKYLGYDSIFSLYGKALDIYSNKKESCELPPKEAVVEEEPKKEEAKAEPNEVQMVPEGSEVHTSETPEKSF